MKKGYNVCLISSQGESIEEFCAEERVRFIGVDMGRKASLLNDIISFKRLLSIIKRERPDIINASTPKASLLVLVAAWICRVPFRVYTCRGFVHSSRTGFSKLFLKKLEKFRYKISHQTICVGKLLMEEGIKDNIFQREKCVIIHNGGSNGIDLEKYNKTSFKPNLTKESIGLNQVNFVIGFVGRVTRDKGISELLSTFNSLCKEFQDIRLLIIGQNDDGDNFSHYFKKSVDSNSKILWLGYQESVLDYYAMLDILVLPSYREGFSNVTIEAAAMGVPVIGFDVPGVADSIKNGFNGTIVPARNITEFGNAIKAYIVNLDLVKDHGNNGIEWSKKFDSKIIWEGLYRIYQSK